MSRTAHASKPAGFEYWTRRPGNACGGLPGPFTKKNTHRRERMQGRQQCRGGVEE